MRILTYNTKMASNTRKRVHETESEDDMAKNHSPKKKASSQSFHKKYIEKYPVLQESSRGPHFAYCTVCRCDFSVAHGGFDDCRRHIETKKHVVASSLPKSSQAITSFFEKKSTLEPLVEEVTRSETLMVELITDLNLPLTAADRFTEACKLMFPDSKIAKYFSCGRSKATAIVKKLGTGLKEELLSWMRKGPFSISTDGSNDTTEKMFPLVVRTLDPNTGLVQSELLSLPFLSDHAIGIDVFVGENIFKLIEHELEAASTPWGNCIAFGSDNANVMTGKHKGVYGFLTRKHPEMYLAGCICHLIHIAARNASSQLSLKIDELLVDVYYYIDKSSKRLSDLKTFQLQEEVKSTNILKHVSTRWLSLRTCLPHLLDNWEALKEIFSKEKSNQVTKSSSQGDRLQRLYTTFKSPTSKLYCLFLKGALDVFDEVNLSLRCAEPKIYILRRTIFKLQRSLFERFLKPVALANKQEELLVDVQFQQSYHHKTDAEITIGDEARNFINDAEKNCLRQEKIQSFYTEVKKFYMEASAYIIKSFPVKDKLLAHAEVTDPVVVKNILQTDANLAGKSSKYIPVKDAHLESVKYFINQYPVLIPSGGSAEAVKLEFCRFQAHILQSEMEIKTGRVDEFWKDIKEITDETGCKKFQLLADFMCGILTIPHSSSHCERIFSCVRKNRTESRASLGQETLEALLVVKSNPKNPCQRASTYTSEQLKTLKSCYKDSLKKK